jgi:hypothetical protein
MLAFPSPIVARHPDVAADEPSSSEEPVNKPLYTRQIREQRKRFAK